MMTREELEAALAVHASQRTHDDLLQIVVAARKQLALMPVDCPDCDGHGCFGFSELQPGGGETCKPCHGSGKVYPQTLIERVLLALPFYLSEVQLVAVLDALGETPKPPPGDTLPWFEDWNSEEDSVYDEMGQ